MQAIWHWGIDMIITLQAVHNPALDAFFNVVTSLGSKEFFLVLLPLLYWCLDKGQAQRLAYLLLLSAYSNSALKGLFALPRPFQFDLRVLKLDPVPAEELGYGFPSGHSQSAMVVWGYLAVWVRRRWMWALAASMIAMIAFSRIYLGVHFPSDALVGLILGVVWLDLFRWLEPGLVGWLSQQPMGLQLGLGVIVPVVLLLAYSSGDAITAAGILIGAGVGIVIERRFVDFGAGGPLWQRAVRLMVGVIILMALRQGLKAVFPGPGEPLYILLRAIRYMLVGVWVTLGGPWLFQRFGLASNDLAVGKG
jgi:membrane-associated phospholipid phosphatase